jgi:hypothetical protein
MQTVRLISGWETNDDFSTGWVHLVADVLSRPTGAIRSCCQAHIICESTCPLVLFLSWSED